jgi:hypothetical protein
MARRGGLIGNSRALSRALESVSRAVGVEVMPVSAAHDLREAGAREARVREEMRDLGWSAYRFAASVPQDMEPVERMKLAARMRTVAVEDANVRRALLLRIAFCFGRGVQKPRAADPQVQDVIDAFWGDHDNQVALLSPEAQWRKGWELWTQSNVFWQLYDDGLDGRVKIAQLHHDLIRDAVWDQGGKGHRVNYYVADEPVGGGWDYGENRVIEPTGKRVVYFEALEASLARDGEPPEAPAPSDRVKAGRTVHLSTNRRSEQAFGIPEGKSNLRWAAAMNDLLGAQVERAKAAASLLSKVTIKGSQRQLLDQATRAASSRSPLGATNAPEAAQSDLPMGPRPGSQWWQNESANIEPLALNAQSDSAAKDIGSARDAFSAGTNFGSHYFGGDPGSLAGSVALELPTSKLTDLDQELVEGLFRGLLDRVVARAVEVGLVSERREATPEEVLKGAALIDEDGTVERDLTYDFAMPNAVERDLPGVVGMMADFLVAIDPNGESKPVTRWATARILRDVFEVDDPAALVDEWWPEDEDDPAVAPNEVPGDPANDDSTAREVAPAAEDAVGPDGKRHPVDNPLGARRDSAAVEAATAAVVRSVRAMARSGDADWDELVGNIPSGE